MATSKNGNSHNNGLVPPKPSALSEATIQNLLDVQSKELSLRSRELDLRIKEIDSNSAHAEKILQTQERDREAERTHARKTSRDKLIFAGLTVIVIIGFMVAGLIMDKDEIVMDLIKILGGFITGIIGGYGYAAIKKDQQQE